MRNLDTTTRENSPHSLNLERSLCSNEDPAQPKIYKIMEKKQTNPNYSMVIIINDTVLHIWKLL